MNHEQQCSSLGREFRKTVQSCWRDDSIPQSNYAENVFYVAQRCFSRVQYHSQCNITAIKHPVKRFVVPGQRIIPLFAIFAESEEIMAK